MLRKVKAFSLGRLSLILLLEGEGYTSAAEYRNLEFRGQLQTENMHLGHYYIPRALGMQVKETTKIDS